MAIIWSKTKKKRENALLEKNSKSVFQLFLLLVLYYNIVSLSINNYKEEKWLSFYEKSSSKWIFISFWPKYI
jgi:hypothetical protein